MTADDPHADIRSGVRALCGRFPPEYFRRLDEARGYPEEFVEALTKAGWLACRPHSRGVRRLWTRIKTTAVRAGDRYIVNGQKAWISRVQHSDLLILLARTTPLPDVKKKSEGLSMPASTMSSGSSSRRLSQVAPISTNLILSYVAEHMLGLPRSL